MIITGGKYKVRKIQAPDEKITRPTLSKVRQGIFNSLYSLIGDFEGKSFLDLFGGSGIIGLEALSRGFETVVVYEKNLKTATILKKNYEILNLKPQIKIGDSLRLIQKSDKIFDVIYIDPPYYSGIYEEIFSSIKKNINNDSIIIAEHASELSIKEFYLIKEKTYGNISISFFKYLK